MVNPGSFRGARKAFLLSEKPAYALGVKESYAADALALILRRYFKRFPVDLPDDVEPTEEQLAAVDDDAADPEFEEPDPEKMTPEEYNAAMEAARVRQVRLNFTTGRIRRWMAYQYEKDHDLSANESGAYNPYRKLFFKLTGSGVERPRLKTAVNVWRKTQREAIDERVKKIVERNKSSGHNGGGKASSLISIRDSVAREMFGGLSEEERRWWQRKATEDHSVAVNEWKGEMESPIKTTPEERQKCIHRLVGFVQPILDLVSEATGWKSSLIIGGPEPAMGGQLNILSIHSGTTTGDVKMNFGRAERARFRKAIVPIYGSFLRKCYTPEECRSRALPAELGYTSMSEMGISMENADYDQVPDIQPPEGTVSGQAVSGSSTTPSSTSSGASTTSTTHPAPVNSAGSQSSRSPSSGVQTTSTSRNLTASGTSSNPVATPTTIPKEATAPTGSVGLENISSVASAPEAPSVSTKASTLPAAANQEGLATRAVADGGEDDQEENPFPFTFDSSPTPNSPVPSPLPSPAHSRQASPEITTDRLPSPVLVPVTAPAPPQTVSSTLLRQSSPSQTLPSLPEAPMDVDGDNLSSVEAGARIGRRSTRVLKVTATSQDETTTGKVGGKRALEDDVDGSTELVAEAHKKKKRTSSARSRVRQPPGLSVDKSTAKQPSNPPHWFTKARSMLAVSELGTEWTSLVESWMEFEASENYTEVSNLSASGRPEVVKDWIQRARSATWRPTIANVDNYAAQFTAWWASLQPEWRKGGEISTTKTEGEWDLVRKGGANGLLSVVAALFFWGLAVQKKGGAEKKKWLEASKDVDFVLSRLVATK